MICTEYFFLFSIYYLYCAIQGPSVCLLLHSPFVVNMLYCGSSRLKWPRLATVIILSHGLKITTACDMQSRTSPFPRTFFSIASIFGVLTENTNHVLSAASLLSDHRLAPPSICRCNYARERWRAELEQNLEDRTSHFAHLSPLTGIYILNRTATHFQQASALKYFWVHISFSP